MARVVVLDTSPLWLASLAPGKPKADDCRNWIAGLLGKGHVVALPEIADYEVRRELLLRGATASLRRLNSHRSTLDFQPIDTPIMLKAAELWALLRRTGGPTAGAQELDGDAILAATTLMAWSTGDTVTLASSNVSHLMRFPGVDARDWTTIT